MFSIEWLSNPQERARFALHVKIFEKDVGNDYAVVEHIFRGKTREEALGYYKAHLGTCPFFRGCVENDRFKNIDCWHTSEWRNL